MKLYPYYDHKPFIATSAYIAPSATLIGKVRIGEESSVWFNCILRGDEDFINVGNMTNIQDLTVIHSDRGIAVEIGNEVTIGHRCVIHGCRIEDCCLIGMGAIIMNGAVIGRGSIIAAGAVVLEKTIIPPFSLVTGMPAKVKQQIPQEQLSRNRKPARTYVGRAREYKDLGI